jgi:hypothetical protein
MELRSLKVIIKSSGRCNIENLCHLDVASTKTLHDHL